MAIATPHYNALGELYRRGELPQGGSILEIGEANYYGDLPLEQLLVDMKAIHHGQRGDQLLQRFHEVLEIRGGNAYPKGEWSAFDLVKIIYGVFFNPLCVASIDMHGTPTALKVDLNQPIPSQTGMSSEFDTVINHGTAEHVFNIAQVFRTMHDHCAVGGLMIHESPFTGWCDHGFYTLQPTLYLDVAAANGYQLVYFALTEIKAKILQEIESREALLAQIAANQVPNNAMLFVALRKMHDEPFKVPMQGYYADSIGPEAKAAWHKLR